MNRNEPVRHDSRDPGVPLFVDLDGTLVATDTILESAILWVKMNPFRPWRLASWMWEGRARWKRRLAEAGAVPDPATLPYRDEVTSFLRGERASGRALVLATGADTLVATAVADHLDLFDAVVASDGRANVKGRNKLEAIREICKARGWKQFAYMGDTTSDLPVWEASSQVYAVEPGPVTLARLRMRRTPERVFRSRKRVRAVFRALRPLQWTKNLLIILPLLLAHAWADVNRLVLGGVAVIAFCLVASAGYVINDLLDLESDRHHPDKRRRVFASGDLPGVYGPPLAATLFALAMALSITVLPRSFVACLITYLALTFAYSWWLKQKLLIDVLLLAGLYSLRLVAGGYATNVAVSEWLLAFSGFLFLSLAFVKRYSELTRVRLNDGSERVRGRGYTLTDLSVIESVGPASGYLAVLVLALYINSQQVTELYANTAVLWLLCPLLLYWITRVWFLAKRGHVKEDPVVFAFSDRVSYLAGSVAVLIVVLAMLGWGPQLPG